MGILQQSAEMTAADLPMHVSTEEEQQEYMSRLQQSARPTSI